MVSRKTVTIPEEHLLEPKKVTCEDCRFMREENTDGEESHICLAHAHRKIDPRKKKECQRYLKNAVDQKTHLIEFKHENRKNADFFDTEQLHNLMSGKDK